MELALRNQPPAMEDPGALISTHGPLFEKEDLASEIVVAPTVIAFTADAGDLVHASP
jgi:hypothetical protein